MSDNETYAKEMSNEVFPIVPFENQVYISEWMDTINGESKVNCVIMNADNSKKFWMDEYGNRFNDSELSYMISKPRYNRSSKKSDY